MTQRTRQQILENKYNHYMYIGKFLSDLIFTSQILGMVVNGCYTVIHIIYINMVKIILLVCIVQISFWIISASSVLLLLCSCNGNGIIFISTQLEVITYTFADFFTWWLRKIKFISKFIPLFFAKDFKSVLSFFII